MTLSNRPGSTGVLAGVGLAGFLAVCCAAPVLLGGGVAAGLAAGWLQSWPLLLGAGALLAAAAWWGWRRRRSGCPTPSATQADGEVAEEATGETGRARSTGRRSTR